MGLLSGVLLLPITGPVRGFRAILDVIQAEVERQMPSAGQMQGRLVELEMRHSTGQIDDAEYQAEQARLLEELNQMRA
ncbi:MAG: gas vesicle protein GvpG [Chloroflexi bacterium]|nr:gas vesicle protein GvpG [Chloroflexota bacterium]